jgi:hypothetical protein
MAVMLIFEKVNELKYFEYLVLCLEEELDGPLISALGVRSQKLSNILKGQS